MTDGDLDLALAEESTATTTASEENLVEVPEATELSEAPEETISAVMMTIEPPESSSAIEAGTDEAELVIREVESEATQPEAEDFVIIDEPALKVGFVKRWTRKIVSWVKRVFKWGKK